MPRCTLAFNLPEETEEFEHAFNGSKYSSILYELDNYLRNKLKYTECSDDQRVIYKEIRDKLWELKNDE